MTKLPPPPPGRWNRKRNKPPLTAPALPAMPPPPEVEVYEPSVPDDGPPVDPMDLSELSPGEREQLLEILSEFAEREMEALGLFEAMPEQERFFSSQADERIALGGNRGGKTTCSCVEIARACTGQDPHDKYPKEDGRVILVGKDLTHCSKVFYQKLFKPGAFQVIRDAHTNQWRVFRPNDSEDIDREEEARMAPPLVSPRYYDFKKISWENKKEELPRTITFKNGWQLHFFSSLGVPPQGWDVDLCVFDEEIEHPRWYPEMSARLLDRRKRNRRSGKVRSGKFVWSATPQAGTVQLYELWRRAEEEEQEPQRSIEVFRFGMLDNAYMSEHAKQAFIKKVATNEEEYRVRVLGHFALLGTRVYGDFLPRGPHGTDAFPIPHDWTRYAAVDPGRQVCAILFVAVPPPSDPEHGGRVYIYDELYIRRANAAIVAEELRKRLADQVIQAYIIDARSGRITEIGSGITHEEQYRRAFVKAGVMGRPGQPTGFLWSTASGGDDVKNGIEAVRANWHLDESGRPRWLVLRDKVPKLCWEAEIYSYRRLPTGLVTDEIVKHNDHLMDCLRYLAMARLKHVKVKPGKARPSGTAEILKRKRERARARGDLENSVRLF